LTVATIGIKKGKEGYEPPMHYRLMSGGRTTEFPLLCPPLSGAVVVARMALAYLYSVARRQSSSANRARPGGYYGKMRR